MDKPEADEMDFIKATIAEIERTFPDMPVRTMQPSLREIADAHYAMMDRAEADKAKAGKG